MPKIHAIYIFTPYSHPKTRRDKMYARLSNNEGADDQGADRDGHLADAEAGGSALVVAAAAAGGAGAGGRGGGLCSGRRGRGAVANDGGREGGGEIDLGAGSLPAVVGAVAAAEGKLVGDLMDLVHAVLEVADGLVDDEAGEAAVVVVADDVGTLTAVLHEANVLLLVGDAADDVVVLAGDAVEDGGALAGGSSRAAAGGSGDSGRHFGRMIAWLVD
ncbi:hypothetical protein V2G26_004587 [Clonostachys chloroleuca]